MTLSVTENILYRQDFVPIEVYIVILVATLVFIIVSIMMSYKREGIILSAFSLILSAFCLFSAFYLRTADEFVQLSSTEVANIQTVCLSSGLIYLHLAMMAFAVIILWINVANYTKHTLKLASSENKELKSGDGVV